MSPGRYSSGVIEAYLYLPRLPQHPKTIADWTSLWLSGANWPTNGELDAVEVEPADGKSNVTWHYGPVDSPQALTIGTGSTLTVESPDITPGWHVVDIAYTRRFFAVYYDGRQYTRISSGVLTGSPLSLLVTTIVTPDESSVNKITGGPPVNSDSSPAIMAVKYIKVWSFR